MEIEYNGISYLINKDLYESDDIFYKRLWFICKQQPKNKEEFNEIINYSLFWKNNYYYGCKYNQDIHKKINDLEKFID